MGDAGRWARLEGWTVFEGNSLERLAGLEPESVDACVCDPPYELGFMGKRWDSSGIAYNVDLWRAVLRVLKPGGHLLAFGGTRTYHRMTVAIEDAGFEIRDSIHWIYGSGFPKSLNISKAIDKAAGAEREIVGVNTSLCLPSSQNTHRGFGHGVHTSPNDARNITAPATESAARWNGWGTALKPAHEPIVVARKPLDGTVAHNVETHGTGAINIDACRVGYASAADAAQLAAGVQAIKARGGSMANSWKNSSDLSGASDASTIGRWPPNILLTHAPECRPAGTKSVRSFAGATRGDRTAYGVDLAPRTPGETIRGYGDASGLEKVPAFECVEGCPVAEMDAQSGESVSSTHSRGIGMGYRGDATPRGKTGHIDTGGASRFFPAFRYEAKASRKDRDAGLAGHPIAKAHEVCDRAEGSAGAANPRAGVRTERANIHPTVKPTELMRWLVRLVTPPGGLVLDPFTGSGSTGRAAVLEGARFVGIELSPEYAAIARARIADAEREAGKAGKAGKVTKPTKAKAKPKAARPKSAKPAPVTPEPPSEHVDRRQLEMFA